MYLNKKRLPGVYVKVFANKNYKKQFYRDGYTDMTGSFKYAMAETEGVLEFAILVATDVGGIITKVLPPSALPSYQGQISCQKRKWLIDLIDYLKF